jgi:hypothetical protein
VPGQADLGTAATMRIVEQQPEVDLKFKLDGITVRAKLADYGESIHVAELNGRYVLLIEGSSFQFEKGFSPVELLHPESFEDVARKLIDKPVRPASPLPPAGDDEVPW